MNTFIPRCCLHDVQAATTSSSVASNRAASLTLHHYNRIQVRYRKDPHMQNKMPTLKLTLTLVLTLTDTGASVLTIMLGYRSLYIKMAIAAICPVRVDVCH